jgi:hypothetical protein
LQDRDEVLRPGALQHKWRSVARLNERRIYVFRMANCDCEELGMGEEGEALTTAVELESCGVGFAASAIFDMTFFEPPKSRSHQRAFTAGFALVRLRRHVAPSATEEP